MYKLYVTCILSVSTDKISLALYITSIFKVDTQVSENGLECWLLYIILFFKVDTAMMAFFKTRKELYITFLFKADTPYSH